MKTTLCPGTTSRSSLAVSETCWMWLQRQISTYSLFLIHITFLKLPFTHLTLIHNELNLQDDTRA